MLTSSKIRLKADPVFVIGLDGATFDLLVPLANKGIMPNIKELLEKGTWGDLMSPIPPITPASWTSFFTGVNPGKHGVFGFIQNKYIPGKRSYINSTFIRSKKIWEILSEAGFTSGIINVPVTYPPDEINGYMISGFPTPYNPENYTYPSYLKEEISSKVGKYIIDVKVNDAPQTDIETQEIIEKITYMLHQRQRAILYLIDNHPTDFTVVVYVTMDRLQHLFWKHMDERNKLYNSEKARQHRDNIFDCYRYLDNCIGEILKRLPENGTLILVSDHGFGPIEKNVSMNNWLHQQGFLKIKFPVFLWRKAQRRFLKPLLKDHSHDIWKDELSFIDWSNTAAYSGDIFEQGIFINLKGREPYGIVEPGEEYEKVRKELKNCLLKSIDPETNKPFVDAVYFKEEIYRGDNLTDAPDLFVIMKSYAYITVGGFNFHNYINKTFLTNNKKATGFHRLNGIFIAYGKKIKQGKKISSINMEDVTPTILHLLDIPVPRYLDGHPVVEMYEDDFLSTTPVRWIKGKIEKSEKKEKYFRGEEEKEIQKQLKEIGYL